MNNGTELLLVLSDIYAKTEDAVVQAKIAEDAANQEYNI